MSTPATAGSRDRPRSIPRAVALAGGVFFLVFGLWAMVAPRAFFDAVALFEPYNQHFVQDVGAFQIGLGVVLLLAARRARTDGLVVALLGAGVGSLAHVISHIVGIGLGGTPSMDIPIFVLVTAALLWAGWSSSREDSPDAH